MTALEPDLIPGTLSWLRWHWSSAYAIWKGTGNRFHASRRDGKGEGLSADDVEALRQLIIRDYSADPVPRDLPEPGPPYKIPPQNSLLDACPACGWDRDAHDEYGRCPRRNRPRGTLRAFLRGQGARHIGNRNR